MSTKNTKPKQALLYNLGDLKFTWITENQVLALKTKAGKVITSLTVKGSPSKEELVFSILDRALTLTIKDDSGRNAVYAFLNPDTEQIAINGIPATLTYDGKDITPLNANGKWISVEEEFLVYENKVLKLIKPDLNLIKSIILNSK